MLDNEIPVLLIESPNCRRKYTDGTACDQAVNVETPGLQRLRNQQGTHKNNQNKTAFHWPRFHTNTNALKADWSQVQPLA